MKKLLFLLALVAFVPAAVQAKTLKFPSDAPMAEITIPDSWAPKETDSGIDATSEDSAIYLAIDATDSKGVDKTIDDVFAFLQKNGVTVDDSTKKQSEDKINGMDMTNLDWDGKDSDGNVSIGVSLVSPSAGKLLVITYWGSKADQAKHTDELTAIISSLKPAN